MTTYPENRGVVVVGSPPQPQESTRREKIRKMGKITEEQNSSDSDTTF